MSNDKQKSVKLNAPMAVAKWPKLTEPDYGTAEYPKPEGEYSVKLVWDETDPAFIKFREKLEPYSAAAEAKGRAEFAALKKPQRDKLGDLKINPLFTPVYDENDEPTGQVEMKLTKRASGVVKKGPREGKKWASKPDIYDALGRQIKTKVDIWGGSEIIAAVSFIEGGYFIAGTGICGLKLSLDAVQIITLREGGTRDAASYGFGKHEDGFDASTIAQPVNDEGDDEFSQQDENHTPATSGEPAGSADF